MIKTPTQIAIEALTRYTPDCGSNEEAYMEAAPDGDCLMRADVLAAVAAPESALTPDQIFDIADPYFAWDDENWQKSTQGTIGMPNVLNFARALLNAAPAAQGSIDAAAAFGAADPMAFFADFCERSGYPSDGPMDATFRAMFYEGIRYCAVHTPAHIAQRSASADEAMGRMRSAFHVNMMRAYPEKSHEEITEAIDKACGDQDSTPAAPVADSPPERAINFSEALFIAQVKASMPVAGDLPPPAHRGPDGTGSYFDSFTADQMRAFRAEGIAADRAARLAAAPVKPNKTVVRENRITEQAAGQAELGEILNIPKECVGYIVAPTEQAIDYDGKPIVPVGAAPAEQAPPVACSACYGLGYGLDGKACPCGCRAPAPAQPAPTFNEAEFATMVEKGTKAWAGVPDAWLEEHRDGTEQAPPHSVKFNGVRKRDEHGKVTFEVPEGVPAYEPAPQGVPEAAQSSFDTGYIGRKLAIITRDLLHYTAQEMARELVRLAKVADAIEATNEAGSALVAPQPIQAEAATARIRSAFHINMMRAYPEKSHEEIAAAIDKACGEQELDPQAASVQDDSHAFKNFHHNLCKRFGYTHDERDWRRDQISLIEFIANLVKLNSGAAALYNELIYAVSSKYPGESRHQTALRYIIERETPTDAIRALISKEGA